MIRTYRRRRALTSSIHRPPPHRGACRRLDSSSRLAGASIRSSHSPQATCRYRSSRATLEPDRTPQSLRGRLRRIGAPEPTAAGPAAPAGSSGLGERRGHSESAGYGAGSESKPASLQPARSPAGPGPQQPASSPHRVAASSPLRRSRTPPRCGRRGRRGRRRERPAAGTFPARRRRRRTDVGFPRSA